MHDERFKIDTLKKRRPQLHFTFNREMKQNNALHTEPRPGERGRSPRKTWT
uniref:Uncharacterized protein n=1 Tax=Rubinisphaera brasiliensis (strain ATCC 49424 / DSM 5305 / JCM 21570 / IAM 15109 / NBRC 103401 / IFAM 1448) TaxID=756272 RepID=F0SGS4_RUBBR|nr:hypothetical protein Plabr_0732 [Rubinisphaera brasiliensis DSM 5305]